MLVSGQTIIYVVGRLEIADENFALELAAFWNFFRAHVKGELLSLSVMPPIDGHIAFDLVDGRPGAAMIPRDAFEIAAFARRFDLALNLARFGVIGVVAPCVHQCFDRDGVSFELLARRGVGDDPRIEIERDAAAFAFEYLRSAAFAAVRVAVQDELTAVRTIVIRILICHSLSFYRTRLHAVRIMRLLSICVTIGKSPS